VSEVISLVLEDEDLMELMRVLMDDDADGALAWLKAHLNGKASHMLEDRSRPKHRPQ